VEGEGGESASLVAVKTKRNRSGEAPEVKRRIPRKGRVKIIIWSEVAKSGARFAPGGSVNGSQGPKNLTD